MANGFRAGNPVFDTPSFVGLDPAHLACSPLPSWERVRVRGEPLIRLDAEGISPPSPARGEGLTHLQIHNSETRGQALCPPGEGVVGGWPSWVAYSKSSAGAH